jgi:sigma-E factor negative regulatory protein RseC
MVELIEHTGVVERIENGVLLVRIEQLSACADCHAKGACSTADKQEKLIEAIDTKPFSSVGDKVLIVGRNSLGLKAVGIAFLIPFLLIFLTLSIAKWQGLNDAVSGILGLGILVPFYIGLYFFKDKLKRTFVFTVRK